MNGYLAIRPAGRTPQSGRLSVCVLALLLAGLVSGCSFKRVAAYQLGNALAGSGSTFASDDDLEVVRAAVPFSLKLMESVLAETPKHARLLTATAGGFTQYTYAFVQLDADLLAESDLDAAQAMRTRARRLYLRARDYGLRAMDARHRGFSQQLRTNAPAAVARLKKGDVPAAYWTAAAWGSAISILKDNTDLFADLPLVEALVERGLALDETFGEGALHSFMISYSMARPGKAHEMVAHAATHFQRAVELSKGQFAGPYLAMAESVAVPEQDLKLFNSMLDQALKVDVEARPESRLENLVMQKRARWLRSRTADLFEVEEPSPNPAAKP